MKFLLFFILTKYLFAIDLPKTNIYNENKHFIENWYMSEKLDGIRAYWTGKELLSKNGNKIYAPYWFVEKFPPFELDGELWTKRADFENIQSIVLDLKPNSNWNKITYNIFEVPKTEGNFDKRLKKLEMWLDKNPNNYIKIIPQIICKDKNHLNTYLEELINQKAEGIILRNPTTEYNNSTSNNILKVKTFFDDEGIVIGHTYKNKKLKSLILKMKNNQIFKLGNGFTDIERLNPPQIGDVVTFKYYQLTKNSKPKFASFLRVRKKE